MALQLAVPHNERPELAASFGKPAGAEPDNPTALPIEVLEKFCWTFMIRKPQSSIPSLYRLSMPASREATGWHYFLPSEAGYRELRRLLDFLLSHKIIDPHNVCLVDADDLLDQPAKYTEAYCKYIGIDYKPEMLRWDSEEDDAQASEVFGTWTAFHLDAIHSRGLNARPIVRVSYLPYSMEHGKDVRYRRLLD